MIRIIGFLIIVVSSAKIGYDISKKYCDRRKELQGFIKVLERVKNEISFSNCIITDALVKASEVQNDTIKKMINYISDKIENGKMTLADAFGMFVKENEVAFYKEDVEEIFKFFSAFGSGDREDEVNNIKNTISNIKTHLHTAVENEKKYVKLFRASGFLTGCLIAIILA